MEVSIPSSESDVQGGHDKSVEAVREFALRWTTVAQARREARHHGKVREFALRWAAQAQARREARHRGKGCEPSPLVRSPTIMRAVAAAKSVKLGRTDQREEQIPRTSGALATSYVGVLQERYEKRFIDAVVRLQRVPQRVSSRPTRARLLRGCPPLPRAQPVPLVTSRRR